jgi:hypothetical protein
LGKLGITFSKNLKSENGILSVDFTFQLSRFIYGLTSWNNHFRLVCGKGIENTFGPLQNALSMH